MKIAIISDVHVVAPDDLAHQLLMKFLHHEKVQTADVVVLLGDIFDVMVGGYTEYRQLYNEFFSELERLLQAGKEIHYFEGNHDFHLRRLFEVGSFPHFGKRFTLHQEKNFEVEWGGKHYVLGHGDGTLSRERFYRVYKWFITSSLVAFLLTIVPYSFVSWIGHRASGESKGYRRANNFKQSDWRDHFRKDVQKRVQKRMVDFVILGHFHLQDAIMLSRSDGGQFCYLNNGDAFVEKTFLYLENHQHHFVSLT